MKRFALGFVFGVAVTVAVVVALPDEESPIASQPSVVADATAAEPVARDEEPKPVRRRSVEAAASVMPEERASAQAESSSSPDAVFRRVRELMASGDLDAAGIALSAAVTEHRNVPPPRELIVALAHATDENLRHPSNHPWGDIVAGLHRWPNEWHVKALEELTADADGSHPLAILSGVIASVLAQRGHAQSDLAGRLAESPSFGHRLSGLHLAATAQNVGYDLLARAAREDAHEDVRHAAMIHLRNRGIGMGDLTARPLLGAIAVEMFDGVASPRLREAAVTGLVYGGPRGIEIAEQVVYEGGLDDEPEAQLMESLLEAGRFRSLFARGTSDVEFLVRLAGGVFNMHDPDSEYVLALWPHLPDLLDDPFQEWTEYVGETLVEIGRFDLAEEVGANKSLLPEVRSGAIYPLAEYADRDRALRLVRAVLGDADEPVSLRKDVLWTLDVIARVGTDAQAAEAYALAKAAERDDPNAWVRREAQLTREAIEIRLADRESEE